MFSANWQEGQNNPWNVGDEPKDSVTLIYNESCHILLLYYSHNYSSNLISILIHLTLRVIHIFCVRIGLGLGGLGVYRHMVKRFLIRIASVSRGHHQAHDPHTCAHSSATKQPSFTLSNCLAKTTPTARSILIQ